MTNVPPPFTIAIFRPSGDQDGRPGMPMCLQAPGDAGVVSRPDGVISLIPQSTL